MISSQTEEAGYSGTSSFDNILLELLFVGGIVGFILLITLLYCCFKRVKKFRECINKILSKIFCNTIIRYSLEKSITIAIASMATVKIMNFDNFSEGFSTMYAFMMVFILLNLMFFYPAFLNRNRKILRRSKFTKKYGSLTLNLKTKQFWPLMYHFFFIARRILLATLIIFSTKYPWAQIYLITLICCI